MALSDEAARENRTVYIATTAQSVERTEGSLRPLSAAEARDRIRSIAPVPWTVDYAPVRAQIEALELSRPATAMWLSSGLDGPDKERADAGAKPLELALQRLGSLRYVHPAPAEQPLVIAATQSATDGVLVRVVRLNADGARSAALIASDEDGRLLGRQAFTFDDGVETAEVLLAMPSELRNRISRVGVEDARHAGAVMLFDESLRRRPVGIVSGDTAQLDQPLIGNAFYLNRALEPFAEVRNGTVEALLERRLAVMVLSDIGTLTETEIERLETWIADGGVLVRFAGPNLADGTDRLLPVDLRRGGRVFGGVMSWDQPSKLASFDETSPFAGLIPSDEIIVRRQVLAQPSPELASKTWARLEDGTPLVTGEKRADGWLVLFHTTANAEWSSLAFSGLYVDMLRRLVALSQGVASDNTATRPLPPLSTLDGFGRLSEPLNTSRALPAGAGEDVTPGPRTPPGFYGVAQSRRAINLGPSLAPRLFDAHASGVETAEYGPTLQRELRVWFLVAAFGLLLADFIISLVLRGLTPRITRAAAAAAICLARADS
ncbi:MAG: hypothetical protein HN420_08715 [Rhodospirillaceae bacterium]|nr:hypothetical protein [Rhodospirillaceae bacterium]